MPPIPVDLWEWEFYYPPVAYTGHFWTQEDPTVHCTVYNVHILHVQFNVLG